MDVWPLEGPLAGHDHLLPLVLGIGKSPVKVPVVLKLEVARVELCDEHSTGGYCDLGEWGMGEWEYGELGMGNGGLTTRGSELFSRTGMSPVVSRYVPAIIIHYQQSSTHTQPLSIVLRRPTDNYESGCIYT